MLVKKKKCDYRNKFPLKPALTQKPCFRDTEEKISKQRSKSQLCVSGTQNKSAYQVTLLQTERKIKNGLLLSQLQTLLNSYLALNKFDCLLNLILHNMQNFAIWKEHPSFHVWQRKNECYMKRNLGYDYYSSIYFSTCCPLRHT